MRVLLTGAFGNVGRSTLDELISQGHQATCFDIWTEENERAAQEYGDRVRFVWGDLRNADEVAKAVQGQEDVQAQRVFAQESVG